MLDGSQLWRVSWSPCTCGHNHFACKEGFYAQVFQLSFLDKTQSCSQIPKSKAAEICKPNFFNTSKMFYFYYVVYSSHISTFQRLQVALKQNQQTNNQTKPHILTIKMDLLEFYSGSESWRLIAGININSNLQVKMEEMVSRKWQWIFISDPN